MYQRMERFNRPLPPMRQEKPASTAGLLVMASIFALIGSLLMGYVVVQKTIEMQAIVLLDQLTLKAMPKYDIRYRNVRVSVWERAIRINGISIQPLGERETIRIDRVSLSEVDWDTILRLAQTGGLPTLPRTVRMGFDGLHLTPRHLGASAAETLASMGYEEVNLSMSAGFLFDRSARVFGVDRMVIEGRDMARFTLSFQVGDFPYPTDRDLVAYSRNKDQKLEITNPGSDLTFRNAVVRIDDFSLVGRIDRMLAKEGKPSLAQFVQMANRMPAESGGVMADAVTKVNAFVSRPNRSIGLSARPNEPIPFDALKLEALLGPEKLAKTLNLRIEVN